jgi:hypothetical protein
MAMPNSAFRKHADERRREGDRQGDHADGEADGEFRRVKQVLEIRQQRLGAINA